jgi:hypothetical protein
MGPIEPHRIFNTADADDVPRPHSWRIHHMAFGKRRSERVGFAKGIPVRMVGLDGKWSRDCFMVDASATGARLTIDGSLAGQDFREFFLLLSSTGLVYRRCRTVRHAGDQIGIEFVEPSKVKAKTFSAATALPRPSDRDRIVAASHDRPAKIDRRET